MSRCPDASAFSAFVSGVLPAGERTELELHIDACERCRVALSETCRRAMPARSGVALPVTGDRVGRYTIGERLGAGAMGVVYAARDGELDRDVAIKLVQPQAGAPEEELVRQRMLREGRALARIDHPNVVRVYDVGSWSGALFVAMERVAGGSLRAWLAAERRSAAAIVDVFVQCAHGLAAAHAAGVIHRDIKPDNVIVDANGRARVTDFGLARTTDTPEPIADEASAPGTTAVAVEDPRLTRTHGVVGTPAYMAPELHAGGVADERSDQFALCVALVEALTGERPAAGATLAGVPRPARGAVERGLASEPHARFGSLDELARALAPRRARWPYVVTVLAAAAGVALYAALPARSDGCAAAAEGMAETWYAGRAPLLGGYARSTLDRYAESWRAARVEACRAERPLEIRCLERRRRELDALLATWDAGTAVVTAPEAIDALAPPARCASAELDRVPASSVVLAGLEARFAAASADARVGRLRSAATALTALASELGELPALRAETLVELARTERDLDHSAQAREHLIAALAAAETAGAARTRALAWIDLAELAGDDAVKLDEARDALRLSGAVIEHLGKPEDLVLRREVARGIVAVRAGDSAEAIAALQAAVRGTLPPTELARRLQILARALISAGRADAALGELERAERVIVDALGRDAPPLVYIYNTMIEPLDYLGRRDEAIARGERALVLLDASYGQEHRFRVTTLSNLAVVYGNVHNYKRALELFGDVLAFFERTHDDYRIAQALINIASTQLDSGTTAGTVAALERALAILTRQLGPEHPLCANVHSTLAQAHQKLHDNEAAVAHARRALAIREAAEVGTGYIAFSRLELADVLVAAGHRAEGIAMARRALELPLASTGREGELAAQIRSWLAEQLR